MNNISKLVSHYSRNGLVERLTRALDDAGLQNEGQISWAELAPLDQFHTRGLEATIELAELAELPAKAKIIDVGAGLGGPSRYLAASFDCMVQGIDITPEFVEAATYLARRCGLDGRVEYRCADALALPFDDCTFDLAWSQHVAMNIADKDRLYSEIFRVLRPGGRFAVYDVTAGDVGEVIFPVPWSAGADTSFLLSPDAMRTKLEHAGFRTVCWADRSRDGVDWFDARNARQANPASTSLGQHIPMGAEFGTMIRNLDRNLREGRVRLTEAVLERP